MCGSTFRASPPPDQNGQYVSYSAWLDLDRSDLRRVLRVSVILVNAAVDGLFILRQQDRELPRGAQKVTMDLQQIPEERVKRLHRQSGEVRFGYYQVSSI